MDLLVTICTPTNGKETLNKLSSLFDNTYRKRNLHNEGILHLPSLLDKWRIKSGDSRGLGSKYMHIYPKCI
jgi:hypothetical protein